MTKTQLRIMLLPNITALRSINSTLALGKWQRSKIIFDMGAMVNWQLSPYKSFGNYVQSELSDMSLTSILTWRYTYSKAMKLKYTWKNIIYIANKVSYRKATMLLTTLDKKIPVHQFIAIIKKAPGSAAFRKKVGNVNQINMLLSNLHIAKLEAILSTFGYIPPKSGSRHGLSEAFGKLLDTL